MSEILDVWTNWNRPWDAETSFVSDQACLLNADFLLHPNRAAAQLVRRYGCHQCGTPAIEGRIKYSTMVNFEIDSSHSE